MNGKLTQIFANCDEQFIKQTVLYAITDAAHLTMDEEGEEEIDKDNLLDLALKGIVIKVDNAYYVPTVIEETGAYLTITCAANGTAKTFYSSEQV